MLTVIGSSVMTREITLSESCCVTTLRSVAMIMIVACHIVLSYGSKYYAVLNIGVQIFFVLSAFLFSQKDITDPVVWLKRRILKLYPQLFIFFVLAFSLLFTVRPELYNFKKLIVYFLNCQYFLGKGQYEEFDHLWFMTTIFVCYFVTPLLQRLSKVRTVPIIGVLAIMVTNYFFTNGKLDWLLLYSFAYLLFRQNKNAKVLVVALMVLALIGVSFFISWEHVINVDWQRLILYNLVSLLVLTLGLWLFRRYNWNRVPRYVEWISTLSFEIYIVHNFFINGTFSCSHLTNHMLANIAIILLLTICSATLLKASANTIATKFK